MASEFINLFCSPSGSREASRWTREDDALADVIDMLDDGRFIYEGTMRCDTGSVFGPVLSRYSLEARAYACIQERDEERIAIIRHERSFGSPR